MRRIGTKKGDMVLNRDNETFRYFGVAQYPMSKADQKRAGLLAAESRSIHGRSVRAPSEGF